MTDINQLRRRVPTEADSYGSNFDRSPLTNSEVLVLLDLAELGQLSIDWQDAINASSMRRAMKAWHAKRDEIDACPVSCRCERHV